MFWKSLIKIINLKYSLDHVLSIFVKESCRTLSVDQCSVFILDETDEVYTLSASTLVPGIKSGMIYFNIKNDLLGKVALREEAFVLQDIIKSNQHSVLTTFSREIYYSLLATPIIYKSKVIAIMALQVKQRDKIHESLQMNAATLCANLSVPLSRAINVDDVSEQIGEKYSSMIYFDGSTINSGVQQGTAFARYNITDIENIPDKETQSEDEKHLFNLALQDVKKDLKNMSERISLSATDDEENLFQSYLQILESSSFYEKILSYLNEGVWLQTAIKKVVFEQVAIFEKMKDPYLVVRASDIKDLGKRLLLYLENKTIGSVNYPSDTILVASEVTASMIAEVPKGRLKAIITAHGSPFSHASIIAKALAIPFVTNINALPVGFVDGKKVIIDAYIGRVYINPNLGLLNAYERIIFCESKKVIELQAVKNLPNKTTDLRKLDLNANVGLIADVDRALHQGADSIGLYRSEVPFIIRDSFPSEDEQRIIYNQILSAFPHKSVVIRVLDVGADKTLPYFYEKEKNPALGWRGIRMMLDQSNLFLMQVRAMLKASVNLNNLRILLPMITTIEEVKKAKNLIKQAYKEVIEESFDIKFPEIGIMVEVPSTLVLIDKILPLVSFVSIGSNDLTQYILAVDRTNDKVINLYDQLNPAMVKTYYYLSKMAIKLGKEVSICGEVGGNPLATPLLIAMGFNSISMNPAEILRIKYILRHVSYKQCKNVLKQVLKLSSTKEIHTYLEKFLVENNLKGIIRAGSNVNT